MKNELATAIEWDKVVVTDKIEVRIISAFKPIVPLLDAIVLEQLVGSIFPAAARAFSVPLSEGFYRDVLEHVVSADMLAVALVEKEVVGFASVKDLAELDTFFLHGIAIDPIHHKLGAASQMLDVLLSESSRSRIAFTTQNPKMFCLLRSKAETCFPSPESQTVDKREWGYTTKLMLGRRGEFNPETSVATSLYSECLYPSILPSVDNGVNEWFNHSLEIKEGRTRNGILLCGRR
jgi:hypothetical protein